MKLRYVVYSWAVFWMAYFTYARVEIPTWWDNLELIGLIVYATVAVSSVMITLFCPIIEIILIKEERKQQDVV